MATLDMEKNIDWAACELIETIPGKVSGRPIVRGTRILPDAILNGYDAGESLDLIHENYPGLSMSQIQRLIDFYFCRGLWSIHREASGARSDLQRITGDW